MIVKVADIYYDGPSPPANADMRYCGINVGVLDVVEREGRYQLIWGVEKLRALIASNTVEAYCYTHNLSEDEVVEARKMYSWPRLHKHFTKAEKIDMVNCATEYSKAYLEDVLEREVPSAMVEEFLSEVREHLTTAVEANIL